MSPSAPSSSRLSLRHALPLLLAASFAPSVQAADLLTITQDALANSSSLNASRATFRSTEAGQDVSRGTLLPQISATGSLYRSDSLETQHAAGASAGAGAGAGGSTSGQDYNGSSLGVNVTQVLFDASNWYQYQQSKKQVGQQALQLEIDQQQLLYDVSSAYFEILRAKEVLDAREAQSKAIGRQLEQAKEQFNVGLVAITDVNEAKAAYDSARAQLISARSDLQVSFEALERLTGKQYDSIDGLADDLPIASPKPATRDDWVNLAMTSSPSIRYAEAGVDVAKSSVDIARAGHLPTLNAYADYAYSDNDIDALRGHNENVEVGVQANLPIYSGGSTSASVRQNTYSLESTQYDFEDQRRYTTQQVRSLFTQVVNDVESVDAQREAIVSSRSALEATRAGYEVGTRNIVDVLNAEQSLYESISNYADARYTYVTDLLQLRQQAGVLSLDVIRGTNQWLRDSKRVSLDLADTQRRGSPTDDIGARPTPPTP
ncbi:TolC family outer membrane protein [Salinicola sp. JS01]|uniref:TolC family outer membrane protein n=1 Tax=Salinicola sp. JS01 TaxID=3050071 RepID=UPI00255BD899|nr:TolC family outer membrane protein [Salinicola sp. JS01]WIX33772.1 TolC family outer membrane protein [Salinicola sp. JS01]